MKALLFWHGQYVDQFANNFYYWRGWVAELDGKWHVYYQEGHLAYSPGASPPGGSSRIGSVIQSCQANAEILLRERVECKVFRNYVGTWCEAAVLTHWVFPLCIPHRDWQPPLSGLAPRSAKESMDCAIPPNDRGKVNECQSPRSLFDIGWRLDPL